MSTSQLDCVFVAPRGVTADGFDALMNDYGQRMADAFTTGDADMSRLPLSPWGGTLADISSTAVTPKASIHPTSSNVGAARFRLGHDLSMGFLDRAHAGVPKSGKADASTGMNHKNENPPPPFPGSNGDIGDYVVWAQFWSKVKPELPENWAIAEIKEQFRNLLIQQGIKFAKGFIENQLTSALVSQLSSAIDDGLATAAIQAGTSFLDDPFGKLGELWDKYTNADFLSEQFFQQGIPALANYGINELFKACGTDEYGSPAGYVATLAARAAIEGLVDNLLSGVTSFGQLQDNFANLQSRLKESIDRFFNGRPFVPGSATLPVARKYDKDDKVDVVITGLDSVVACGSPVARVTDVLAPSAKPITIGSATVLASGLPLGRKTSPTGVPSTIAGGAPTVFVEGSSAGAITPDGALYCPANNPVAGTMSPAPLSKAAARAAAVAKVKEFRDRMNACGNSAYPKLDPKEFADELEKRINDPNSFNQRDGNLCGASSFMTNWANADPIAFTDYAIGLFENGEGQIGALTIVPSSDHLNFDPKGGIKAVDWVTLGGITDASNTFFSLDHIGNSTMAQWEGLTFPSTVASWYQAAGFANVQDTSNPVFAAGPDNLAALTNAVANGQAASMLVWPSSQLMPGHGLSPEPSIFGQHWVAVNNMTVDNVNDTVTFSIATWGKEETHTVPTSVFLEHYHGYVSAEPNT